MHGTLLFAVSFLVSAATLPVYIYLVHKFKIVDTPEARKIHSSATPTLGGLSFVTAFLAYYLLIMDSSHINYWYLSASIIILLAGIYDDIKNISPKLKLLAQITASLIVIFAMNVKLNIIKGDNNLIYTINIIITLIWIVGITNAVNLIDGMDGLAGGISFMSLGALAFIFYGKGQIMNMNICLVLMGGILGFLRYNIPPAYIFMGDTGSLFLGFQVAVMSITASYKTGTLLSTFIPFLFISLPVFDTFLAIIRRLGRGESPFKPDREHLHHRLLDLHFTDRQALTIFYILSVLLASISMYHYQSKAALFSIISSFLIIYLFLVTLKLMKVFNINQMIKKLNDLTIRAFRFKNTDSSYSLGFSDYLFLIMTASLTVYTMLHKTDWVRNELILIPVYVLLLIVSTMWRKIFSIKNEYMGFIIFWFFFFCCYNLVKNNADYIFLFVAINTFFLAASMIKRKHFIPLTINPMEIIIIFCLLLIHRFIGENAEGFFSAAFCSILLYMSNKAFISSGFQKYKTYSFFISILALLLPFSFYLSLFN